MTTTRFAPSPTGYMHIGGIRTALFSYLWAKNNSGEFKLRIEDTDLKRNNEDASQAILQAFEWFELKYTDKIVYQSQRFDLYAKYIQKLIDQDKAYYCYLSKEELELTRKENEKNKQSLRHNKKYRDYKGETPDIKPTVRIKAPNSGKIEFYDKIKGQMSIDATDMDDFIIARSDGAPTYNFVVAIDDALMKITDIIRGDDHLSNTFKQLLVYNALEFDVPSFYHVPMILNESGKNYPKEMVLLM